MWKCSLFSPFSAEAASIIQQHIERAQCNTHRCFFSRFPPSRFLSIYLSPVGLFLCPHFVSRTPSPSLLSSAHFILLLHSVTFPQRELRICQFSHFFLHSLVLILFFSIHPAFLLFYHFFCISGISFLTSPCLLPRLTPSLALSFWNLISLRQFWGAVEEAMEGSYEGRVWPPTLQDSIVFHWFWHTYHISNRMGHAHCVESSCSRRSSLDRRGLFVSEQAIPGYR